MSRGMAPPPPARLDWLLHPSRALAASLLLALVMALPALKLGFFADDYIQTLSIEGAFAASSARPERYQFTEDGEEGVRASIRRGELPWWTQPELKLRFLRPLSGALLTLDYRLFGRAPFGYHLHSLFWYLALVAATGLFFRRVLPGATGAAALLLFTIDDCHASLVDWIACRHMLIAATPALLGLWAHMRYREEGWKPGRWLSFAGIAVGLLGGETALGVIAYWIAYELLAPREGEGEGDAGGWRARLRGAAPVLGFSGAYFILYKALGCGARGNDNYIEPLSDPRAFVLALMERVPILVGNLLAGLPADATMALPSGPFVAAGIAAALGVSLLYRAVVPFIPEAERRALLWLVPGALLSLVTTAGGVPSARLLLMPSLGGAALVATLLRFGLRGAAARGAQINAAEPRPRRFGLRPLGWGIVALVHVAMSSLAFAIAPFLLGQLATRMENIAREAEVGAGPNQHVFLLMASDPLAGLYPGAIRMLSEPGRLSGWHPLSMAKRPHRLIRTGPSSFRLQVVGGRLMETFFEQLYRSSSVPFAIGDEAVYGEARVSVRAVDGGTDGTHGRPTEIEVQFGRPLEDAGLSFLAWQGGRLRRVALPDVGGSIELAWEPGPTGMF